MNRPKVVGINTYTCEKHEFSPRVAFFFRTFARDEMRSPAPPKPRPGFGVCLNEGEAYASGTSRPACSDGPVVVGQRHARRRLGETGACHALAQVALTAFKTGRCRDVLLRRRLAYRRQITEARSRVGLGVRVSSCMRRFDARQPNAASMLRRGFSQVVSRRSASSSSSCENVSRIISAAPVPASSSAASDGYVSL